MKKAQSSFYSPGSYCFSHILSGESVGYSKRCRAGGGVEMELFSEVSHHWKYDLQKQFLCSYVWMKFKSVAMVPMYACKCQ